MMSPLADAIRQVSLGLTGDQLHGIIGGSRATAHRWLRELRDTGSIKHWSATSVEKLATWERQSNGTSYIIDSLCIEESAGDRVDPHEVRAQINQTQRKNSSIMGGLLPIKDINNVDSTTARDLYQKTESALKETASEQSMLRRLMKSLLIRIQKGGQLR